MIASAERNGKSPSWNVVELASCFELQNGVNFSAEQKGSGLLVIDVLNMYSDDLFVRTDKLYRVDIKVPEDRLLRPGDVLFVRSSVKESGVGWPAIFRGHEEPVTNCGFLIRARQTAPKLDPRFFVHYLRQSHVRAQMISRAGKVAITNINQERLGSLKIPLPPLAEQRRIAEVLDRAEALRAKRRAALGQLDSLTQSLFLDLFGDPILNPRKWPQEKLETFFHFRTGKLDSNAAVASGQYPFFTCSRDDFRIDTFAFDCQALLLAGNNASADYSVKHYKASSTPTSAPTSSHSETSAIRMTMLASYWSTASAN